MCSPEFRRFPELPAELRLQIWQEACLAFPTSRRYLQYVTVQKNYYDNEAVAIPCNWPSWPRSLSQNTNRSAYFLNGGLWKACKESRQVIATYTEYHEWLEKHRRPGWDTMEDRGEPPAPATIDYNGEGGEKCRMLVNPSRDIFCIKVDDWQSIHRGYIKMQFIRYNDEDKHSVQRWSLDEYQRLFKEPKVKHIALEFDPSWVADIPDSFVDMKRENSARGYLVDWLSKNADTTRYDGRSSIIDKEAKWIAKRSVQTVCQDFDTEYVEIGWSAVADTSYEGLSPSAAAFMNKICHYQNDIYPWRESVNGWVCSWGPYFGLDINLVVRRDNEVKETIWSCPGECDRDGWCMCSSDETKRRQERLAQRVEP